MEIKIDIPPSITSLSRDIVSPNQEQYQSTNVNETTLWEKDKHQLIWKADEFKAENSLLKVRIFSKFPSDLTKEFTDLQYIFYTF